MTGVVGQSNEVNAQPRMAQIGGGMPELFFKDPQQLDSVERYNVVYRGGTAGQAEAGRW